jgi:magnesium-transporting ATPase (P-type)
LVEEQPLDMMGAHRSSVLFAGTTLVHHTSSLKSSSKSRSEHSNTALPAVPTPDSTVLGPGGGCVCVVLRTGWHSTKGDLVRMATASSSSSSSVSSTLPTSASTQSSLQSGGGDNGASSASLANEHRSETSKLLKALLVIGATAAVSVFFQHLPPPLPRIKSPRDLQREKQSEECGVIRPRSAGSTVVGSWSAAIGESLHRAATPVLTSAFSPITRSSKAVQNLCRRSLRASRVVLAVRYFYAPPWFSV